MVTPLARIRLVSNRSDAGEETGLIHAQRRGITKLWSLLLLGCTVSAWSTRARWARARSPRGRRDRDCVSQPCGFDISSACNMDKKPPWRKTSEEQHRRERKVRRNEERQSIQIKGLQSHNKESNRTRLRGSAPDLAGGRARALWTLYGTVFGFRLPTPLGGDCRHCLCCQHYGEVEAGTKPTGRARVLTTISSISSSI